MTDGIEAHLTDVAVNILVAGENSCREKEVSHYRWLVKHKADLIEWAKKDKEEAEKAERERRVKEEQARLEAKALREAEEIRA